MSAFGWITAGRRLPWVAWLRRSRVRKAFTRQARPGLESLEPIDLMSRGGMVLPAVAALSAPVTPSAMHITGTVKSSGAQTSSATQVAVVPGTLTNFQVAFNPAIKLFDPTLGQLTAVHVTATPRLVSTITSQNTSTTSGADITGNSTADYTITGLPTTITNTLTGTTATVTVPPFPGGTPDFTGPSTVKFPPLTLADNRTFNFTQPADLAFFTSTPGRTTITPVLTANAQAGATAPNGNLQTMVETIGSGTITVTYDFMPRCPAVVKLVRFGIHQQPTVLQLTFDGPANPADVSNPNNYKVIVPNRFGSFTGPGVTIVPIVSATFNPTNNTVDLIPARRLNVHHLFELQVNLPCNNGNVIVIEFGGKRSLAGFTNPHNHNQFVPVVNGRIVRTRR
jgi:hypothetical protein